MKAPTTTKALLHDGPMRDSLIEVSTPAPLEIFVLDKTVPGEPVSAKPSPTGPMPPTLRYRLMRMSPEGRRHFDRHYGHGIAVYSEAQSSQSQVASTGEPKL